MWKIPQNNEFYLGQSNIFIWKCYFILQEVLSLDQIEDIEKSNLKDEEMVVFENASLSWNCTAKKEEISTDNKGSSKTFPFNYP